MSRSIPKWFTISEEATPQVMKRVGATVSDLSLAIQVRSIPMLAFWFLVDSLSLANRANRDGMHANALSLTRQCIEAINVLELGLCGVAGAEEALLNWDSDRLSPGKLRSWLEKNVWKHYGAGLWTEPWSTFMREFAAAIQPYAHYGRSLSQWQLRLHDAHHIAGDEPVGLRWIIEMKPRAYDPQKATRITLFHAILTFTLGRIWIAANANDDPEFQALINRLRVELSVSRYLDGHETDWSQQFWASVWDRSGSTILE